MFQFTARLTINILTQFFLNISNNWISISEKKGFTSQLRNAFALKRGKCILYLLYLLLFSLNLLNDEYVIKK